MKLDKGYILLSDLRFHAFHGVLPQERLVGGNFVVDLRVGYPLAQAMTFDQVDDTLNYASLYALVEREMQQPSSLLEHVAGRIAQAIAKTFPQALSIDLTLTKQNPPMGADCKGAGVEMHFVRSEK
jgi:dihydroneopterin aldolase